MKRKAILNLLHNKKWRCTFAKFKRTIMLFMLIPILLCNIVIAINYANKLNSEINNKIDVANLKVTSELEECFGDLCNIYGNFQNNNEVQMFLLSKLENFSDENIIDSIGKIKELIKYAHTSIEGLHAIEVYSMTNKYVISSVRGGYINELNPKWYEYFRTTRKNDFVIEEDNYLVIAHGLNINDELSGILVFKLDKNKIEDTLLLSHYQVDIGIEIVNMDQTSVLKFGNIGGKIRYSHSFTNESLKMNFIVGNGNSRNIIKLVIIYIALYFVIGLIIAYMLAILCSVYLYDSVCEIISQAGEVRDEEMIKAGRNTFSELKGGDDIEAKLTETLNQLYTAQLAALQMQINPHFVYNVLNYINMVVLNITKSDNDASKMVILLSDILGYAMTEPKKTVKVSKEIEIAKKHLEIERIQSGKDFDVIWDIDDDIQNCECIKLFLQPILENAVMHGIKPLTDKKGKIIISAKKVGKDIEFEIKDNGEKIPEEKLHELQNQLKEPYTNFSKHIGLRNVNERIKLICGKGYGVNITSDEKGTSVLMKIGDISK